jgi:KUP system potassium uptake protein
MDMFLTTCFMSLILLAVWRKNALLVPIFFGVFGLIEWCFLSSSLLKVRSPKHFRMVPQQSTP